MYEDSGIIDGIEYHLRIDSEDFEDFDIITDVKKGYSFVGNKGQFKFFIKDTFNINRKSKKTNCKYHRLWKNELYEIEIRIVAPKERFSKLMQRKRRTKFCGSKYSPCMSKTSAYSSGGYMDIRYAYYGGSFSPK